MNLKNSIIILFVLLLIPTQFKGQNPGNKNINSKSNLIFERPNVVKLNTIALAFSNLSLFYERSVWDKLSVSMGLGYKYKGQSLKIFQTEEKEMKIEMGEIRGLAFSPEIRYYLQNCEMALPSGFYGGIYAKYTGYNSNALLDYRPAGEQSSIVKGDFKLSEFGYGIILGYQLAIKSRFVMDFQFFGPRYSFVTLTGDLSSDVTDEFVSELEDYIDTVFERFIENYNFEIKDRDANNIKAKFQIPNVRFGISIGYSF